MLFNSLEFLLFLPTVFCLYWFVFNKNLKVQNLLLLISSYVFYGWWDWRFLSLIFLSTIVDYFVGLKIYESSDKKTKKSYLWISILFNLGLLGFFKYFNFFIDSWIDLLGTFGYEHQSTWTLNVILPVGISFYTFQTMSYSLDIYYGKLKPTKDFISFASFVSFFPQLVAGPIERASNLLPKILKNRAFKYEQGVQGLRIILWGIFKKVVIADNLGEYVDKVFSNYNMYDGSTLFIILFFFTFQIYCDFSGYSDIAIGVAKLFGIKLSQNFKYPYFSRNIGDFWKKWHISLSSWFRDYVYIPLGGSKRGNLLAVRNIFITFLISGFWHGANWTFIIWGFVHAILYIPLFLFRNKPFSKNKEKLYVNTNLLKKSFQTGITFFAVMIAWVFFRSDSITDAFLYLKKIFSNNLLLSPKNDFLQLSIGADVIIDTGILLIFIIFEFIQKNKKTIFEIENKTLRRTIYYLIILLTLLRYNDGNNFIYFQF